MTRLTKHQEQKLREMASTEGGHSLCPGGYRGAGPDASRWWRTMQILAQHGFVKHTGWQAYRITNAGRERAKEVS